MPYFELLIERSGVLVPALIGHSLLPSTDIFEFHIGSVLETMSLGFVLETMSLGFADVWLLDLIIFGDAMDELTSRLQTLQDTHILL